MKKNKFYVVYIYSICRILNHIAYAIFYHFKCCDFIICIFFISKTLSLIEIDKRMELPCIIEVNVMTLQVTSNRVVNLVELNAERFQEII